MTPQEQQMLQGLADRVNGTQLPEKDADAEQLIQQTIGRNPDALYVMAQTILVQGYALEQAQKQITDLSAQLDQARQAPPEPKHATSFLGNLLGRRDEPARVAPPPPPPPPPPPAPEYSQPQYAGVPMYVPSGGYPIPGQPQGGGFLRSAMQTATGVAAGALAFEGVESLLHGFGHSAGYGPAFGTAGFEGLGGGHPEEVINNYYGDSASHEHEHGDTNVGTAEHEQLFTDHPTDASQFSNTMDLHEGSALHDASYVTSGAGGADDSGVGLNDTSDYSGTDDSITSDDVGGDQGGEQDFGGDDSSGDFGGGDDGSGGF